MNLTDIQDRAKKCHCYAFESDKHICRRCQFFENTCFAFYAYGIPDICTQFLDNNKIKQATIDSIWKRNQPKAHRVHRHKYDGKTMLLEFIVKFLESKKTFTQKDIIERFKKLSPSVIKYHWQAVMDQLGLHWEWRYEGRAHSKVFRIKHRDYRVLKRR